MAKLGINGLHTLGSGLGRLLWLLLPSRRRLATDTIMERLDLPYLEAKKLARQSFIQNGISFVEAVYIPHFGLQHPRLRIADPEVLRRLQTTDRPVVAVTAHLGAWELEAGILGELRSEDISRMVVVRSQGKGALNRLIMTLRSGRGAQVVMHREASKPVLRALRKKGLVAFLVDHNCNQSEAVFLPFLGKIAAVNRGPALLAVRGEALVWPIVVLREKGGYAMHLKEPLDTTTVQGSTEERVAFVAQFYTQAIERLVRHAPEQWFWMHKRWKTQPENLTDVTTTDPK